MSARTSDSLQCGWLVNGRMQLFLLCKRFKCVQFLLTYGEITLYILTSTPPVDRSSFSTILPKSILAGSFGGPEEPARPSLPEAVLLLPEAALLMSRDWRGLLFVDPARLRSIERRIKLTSTLSADAAVSITATREGRAPDFLRPCRQGQKGQVQFR